MCVYILYRAQISFTLYNSYVSFYHGQNYASIFQSTVASFEEEKNVFMYYRHIFVMDLTFLREYLIFMVFTFLTA